MTSFPEVRIAILGASGYSGADLVRLLALHPAARIVALTGERQAGKSMGEVFPHLGGLDLPVLTKIDDVEWSQVDVAFCALPHGTTQAVVKAIPSNVKIVDISADFRLTDAASYAEWYGHEHQATALQAEAVYGLTEHKRAAIRNARLIANPGCYPTSAQLPLVPLLRAGLIDPDEIIIDAKSGVTGAGREAKQDSLYSEVSEGVHAYGVARHRHAPEIEQELGIAAGRDLNIVFTPHLMPMSRGILSTIYVKLTAGHSATDLRRTLVETYADEPFVRVTPEGAGPSTRHVRGSNMALIGVFADRVPGRAILVSVIDNLVKGASGQAIQNMNVMLQIPETTGLSQIAMFP
ncbi:MAG: N-acetyl-gamma-glutamyl-phosphate reductase [Rhodospirillales bacterium]|nr:N-acetyl-gamma-glutamyl-phosphate reductase [Rhodospirillales bacterium]